MIDKPTLGKVIYRALLRSATILPDESDALRAELARLRREVESLRADAERYRWLREAIDHGPLALCEEAAGEPYRWSPIASYCQEVVDAARKPTVPAALDGPFTCKQKGVIAGDGRPCPNDHDPDCRRPQCRCRERPTATAEEWSGVTT